MHKRIEKLGLFYFMHLRRFAIYMILLNEKKREREREIEIDKETQKTTKNNSGS